MEKCYSKIMQMSEWDKAGHTSVRDQMMAQIQVLMAWI